MGVVRVVIGVIWAAVVVLALIWPIATILAWFLCHYYLFRGMLKEFWVDRNYIKYPLSPLLSFYAGLRLIWTGKAPFGI